ncbi:hypothetical protein VTK73DRAFT_5961 [Phialemonium thermophilum]|uniref:Uncharacterized protein n=1 Tax=Phialemonium thermophilum TaxID=223376 RepID=A0ABR3V082_9PEZI
MLLRRDDAALSLRRTWLGDRVGGCTGSSGGVWRRNGIVWGERQLRHRLVRAGRGSSIGAVFAGRWDTT